MTPSSSSSSSLSLHDGSGTMHKLIYHSSLWSDVITLGLVNCLYCARIKQNPIECDFHIETEIHSEKFHTPDDALFTWIENYKCNCALQPVLNKSISNISIDISMVWKFKLVIKCRRCINPKINDFCDMSVYCFVSDVSNWIFGIAERRSRSLCMVIRLFLIFLRKMCSRRLPKVHLKLLSYLWY